MYLTKTFNPIQAGIFGHDIGWGGNVPPSVSPLFVVQLRTTKLGKTVF